MDLPIELLGLGGIISLVVLFSMWKLFSQILLKRRYKPEHDKSRLGEEKRRANPRINAKIARVGTRENYVERPAIAQKREFVPPANFNKIGQNRPGLRRARFFRRRA